jgi:hypothetical protein
MTLRCRIEEPLLSAVRATEELLMKLQIAHAFVGEIALAAWLDRPAAAAPVDVLALLAPDRSRQVPMMASHRGFIVDEDEIERARELDLIPMRFAGPGGTPRIHVLMASNALYSRMLKRAFEVELGDDMIPVAHPEDLGLMLAMQDARETLAALADAAGETFDRDRFNATLVSIGLPRRTLQR